MAGTKEIGNSSISKPIKFFADFYETNYLNILREAWLPKKDDTDYCINRYPYIIDLKEEEYTIEYEVELSGHEEEDSIGYAYWVVDKTELLTKTYFFKQYLNNLFLQEYRNSIYFIEDAIFQKLSINRAKLFCTIILDSLKLYLRTSNSKQFIKYRECARPLEALIRYLLKKYPLLCPNYRTDAQLVKIYHKKWDNIPTNKSLNSAIFSKLVELKDDDEEYLIERKDTVDSTERMQLIRALKNLCDGNSLSLDISIRFNWQAGPVHYIIRKLKNYNNKLELNNIQASQKVFIKKTPFKASNSSTAATRFEENTGPNNYLKAVIDSLFIDHLI